MNEVERLSDTVKTIRGRPGKRLIHDLPEFRVPYDPMTEEEFKAVFARTLHCVLCWGNRHARTMCGQSYSPGSTYGKRTFRKMVALNMDTCPECRAAIERSRT